MLKQKEELTILSEDGTNNIEHTEAVLSAKERDKLRTSKAKFKKQKKQGVFSKLIYKIFGETSTDGRKIAKSTQDTIPYLRVCNNYIIQLEPFKYSKTYRFEDISYTASSPKEQERIFLDYGAIINGFDSTADIQVTIHNNRINEKDFAEQILLKKKKDGFDEYRDEYNEMLLDKMQQGQNGISCKKYITVTVTAVDLETANQRFNTLELHLTTGFQNIGTKLDALNANQRIRILTDIFRGVNKEIRPISTSEFMRGAEKSLCCPDYFEFKKDYFMFNDKYARMVFARQLPSSLKDSILTDIAETNLNLIITVNLAPVEPDKAIKKVKRQLTAMRSNKIQIEKKAAQRGVFTDVINDDLKTSLAEAEELLDDLQGKNQKMFLTNIIVMIVANSYEELQANTEKVDAIFRTHVCTMSTAFLQQEDCMASCLPLGNCRLQVRRTLTTESSCVFMPFNAKELSQEGGMYYGLNAVTKNLLIFNRTKSLINPNGFILGSPGSGKSFAAKREMLNVFLATNSDIIIIDPEREYSPLAKALGGEVVYISENSPSHLNPLDIAIEGEEEPVKEKYNFFLSFFETIMGKSGVLPEQRTIIDNVLHEVYRDYLLNPSAANVPTLSDYYKILALKAKNNPEAKSLLLSLELYVKGSMSTFNAQSNVNINNRVVVYDIKDLGKQLKPLGLMIVLENLWNSMAQNRTARRNTYIYIDEIYLLFRNEESANFLFELWKRARKWGGVPTGITQNVEDCLKSETARSMIANSEFILMLNQAASDREHLAKMLKISDTSMQYVIGSSAGCGLMFAGGNGIIPFADRFPTNTKLYELMTTKFGE